MMLTSDRPDHTRLRRIVARDFTRGAIERRRPDIERLARQAVDDMCADAETDVVARVASPLPVTVIAHLLGVPAEDLPSFRRWSDRIVEGAGVGGDSGSLLSSAHVLDSVVRLNRYLRSHFDHRRRSPGDDILSRLLASSGDGRLNEDELFWFALLLLIAGNETTTNLLGTLVLALARNPDQFARLRAEPGLIPSAVEEGLRYDSPLQGLYRTALRDYEVGPATIPARSRVLLLLPAWRGRGPWGSGSGPPSCSRRPVTGRGSRTRASSAAGPWPRSRGPWRRRPRRRATSRSSGCDLVADGAAPPTHRR